MLNKKNKWRENSSVSKIEYLARLMILEDNNFHKTPNKVGGRVASH
jgi:hypothetical protein